MTIKGISFRVYLSELLKLNKITQKNVKLRPYFWTFKAKFKLRTPLGFSFSDNFRESIIGIRVRYDKLTAFLNTFKPTVDMN